MGLFQPGNTNGFKKGQSGNPGGRPKEVREVAALARERTTQAIETLTEIMLSKKGPPGSTRKCRPRVIGPRVWQAGIVGACQNRSLTGGEARLLAADPGGTGGMEGLPCGDGPVDCQGDGAILREQNHAG